MKIELKKIIQPNGQIWYVVVIDNSHQIPYYATEFEGKTAYEKAIDFHRKGIPQEETILSTEI